jgi:enolase-phosphatase E1
LRQTRDAVRGVLLDVEGTTTPPSFVYETLFPYARSHVARFVHEGRAARDIPQLRREYDADPAPEKPLWRGGSAEASVPGAVAYLEWLMSRDRKSTSLKTIQGRIWEEGYGNGDLRGEVYPDVPSALLRWRRQGRIVAIFSSGSILAQKLLFATTPAGDLAQLLARHFDTTTGPKTDSGSYSRIAEALGLAPPAILFVSDMAGELFAARGVGMDTVLCARTGSPANPGDFPIITTFDALLA